MSNRKTEAERAGEFLLSYEPSSLHSGWVAAADQVFEAGTVLGINGDNDLVEWSGTGDIAGVLLRKTDTRISRVKATFVARRATFVLAELTYPAGKAATTKAALESMGFAVRAVGVLTDDEGGGGGSSPYVLLTEEGEEIITEEGEQIVTEEAA